MPPHGIRKRVRLKCSHSFLMIESYRHCGSNRSHFADHRFWQKDDTFVGALLLGAPAAGGIFRIHSHSKLFFIL